MCQVSLHFIFQSLRIVEVVLKNVLFNYEKYSVLFDSRPRFKEYYEWLLKRANWVDPLIENDYDRFLSPK